MDPFILILIAVASMVGISASILYYLEKTKSDRIRSLKESKSISSEDDAYNKVKNAQSISRILKRKGYDTSEAKKILDDAENQIDKGNYVKAKNLAREAKSKLEQNKMKSPENNKSKKDEKIDEFSKKEGYSIEELKKMDLDSEEMSERAKKMKKQQERLQSLPENYLESKFELDIIREKIHKAKDNEDAQEFFKLAEKYFDEGSYTDALKYSVKCKKAIDGKNSGLLAGQKIDKKKKEKPRKDLPELTKVKEESDTSTESKNESKSRKGVTEEEGAGLYQIKECPSCGYIADPDDKFCSKCGTELEKKYECPNCESEISEEDNFCPKCGTKL